MKTRKAPDVRKSEILAAAIQLFREHGYEKTTVEMILNQLGVAKGCFYYYFQSKDEVFGECVLSLAEGLLTRFREILEQPERPARQRLLDYLDENFRLAAENPALDETVHSTGFASLHERVLKEGSRQMLPVFVRLIEQGQASGEFRVTDARFAAAALLGALGTLHEVYTQAPSIDLQQLRTQTAALADRILQAASQKQLSNGENV